MLNNIDKQIDNNTNCISLVTTMTLKNYKKITAEAFNSKGNIDGQRDVVTSAAASKIRARMFKDFERGAIFPAVVLGFMVDKEEYSNIVKKDSEDLKNYLSKLIEIKMKSMSIIDGMQRSNVYFKNYTGNENREIRVEYWIASDIGSLVYRMLVLNTGQVPWSTRRQVEIVYNPLISSIESDLYKMKSSLNGKIDLKDIEKGRRSNAGVYPKNDVIELFMAFNIKQVKTTVSTQLAEDFQKIDMLESLENSENIMNFIKVFSKFCEFDLVLGECDKKADGRVDDTGGKFKNAFSLFSTQTGRIGFIVAATQFIYGRKGRDLSKEESDENFSRFESIMNKLFDKLSALGAEGLRDFLRYDLLNEAISSLPKNKIGDAEREGFLKAFKELFEDTNIPNSLETLWRKI